MPSSGGSLKENGCWSLSLLVDTFVACDLGILKQISSLYSIYCLPVISTVQNACCSWTSMICTSEYPGHFNGLISNLSPFAWRDSDLINDKATTPSDIFSATHNQKPYSCQLTWNGVGKELEKKFVLLELVRRCPVLVSNGRLYSGGDKIVEKPG